MSSATKRGKIWYIKYRDADDRTKRIATRCITKAEAKDLANELERQAQRIRLGLEVAPAPLPETQGESFAHLMQWWFAKFAYVQSNAASVKYQLDKWIGRKPIGKARIRELKETDCEAWLLSLERTAENPDGLANGTINKLRTWCRSAYREAIKIGRFVGANPWDQTVRRDPRHRKGDWIRPEELPRILAQLPTHLRPLFAITVYTGMRRGEVFGLTKGQVDLERRQLIVDRTASRRSTKSGEDGNVPIVEKAARWFELALALSPPSSDRVFLQPSGKPYNPRFNLARKLQKAARRAGITRYLKFHDLRRTTGVLLTMDGVPIQVVSKILRHSDIAITMKHYQHFQPELLRHEASKLKLTLPTHELAPELEALLSGSTLNGSNLDPSEPETGRTLRKRRA